MTVWVEMKKAIELSDQELAECRNLSYGDEGYMCEDLDHILATERQWRRRYSWVYLVRQQAGSPVIGWSLLEPIYHSPKYRAQFFVDSSYRGRGIGTLLLQTARAFCNRKPVCYVDEENLEFFKKNTHLFTEAK